jgi:hypothetical protein
MAPDLYVHGCHAGDAFSVELLVLVSNNRNSFSNPFFITNTARSLNDASRSLGTSLNEPYDEDTITSWITSSMAFLQSNTRMERPNDYQPLQEEPQNIPQTEPQRQGIHMQTTLFKSKRSHSVGRKAGWWSPRPRGSSWGRITKMISAQR